MRNTIRSSRPLLLALVTTLHVDALVGAIVSGQPPTVSLTTTPLQGSPPLSVRFDASASSTRTGAPLQFSWDFGDGTIAGAGGDSTAILTGMAAEYGAAKARRDANDFAGAVTAYLATADRLLPLTTITTVGPVTAHGTNQIDRVARWYLQKIAHDLGGIYLFHALGLSPCAQYGASLGYSRESVTQASAGGFRWLPSLNGTFVNLDAAKARLTAAGCPIPVPTPMFAVPVAGAGATATHVYSTPGQYTALVTAHDGVATASATAIIVVTALPSPPPGGEGSGPPEGFGSATTGGLGNPVIRIAEATEAAVRTAFKAASAGHAVLSFDVAGPIAIRQPLPTLTGPNLTIEGNGATLVGDRFLTLAPLIEIGGHDVIVRNLRLRNAGDNLRIQGNGAHDIVVSHVSSTGSSDDGISIGYGAHDVTVEWCFLAGNTRSIFIKYGATSNVSLHHSWIMKQWIRGPLASGSALVDVRNVILEDWTQWGMRFEHLATGNVVQSLFRLGGYAAKIGGKGDSALHLQGGPVFTADNVYQGRAVASTDAATATPVPAPVVTTLPVAEMTPLVEAGAGCQPRDAVDQLYIDTRSGWRTTDTAPLRLTAP